MPSPLQIRKNLLQAVEENILPSLLARQTPQFIVAELPIHLPEEIAVTHLPMPLFANGQTDPVSVIQKWPEANFNSFYRFYVGFLFEGQADLRFGTTTGMARNAKVRNQWTRNGCHILHLHAPSFLMIPPGVPYPESGGHWHDAQTPPPNSKIFWMHLLPDGALCHLCCTQNGVHQTEHPLLIKDAALVAVISLLVDELRRRESGHEEIAGDYLLLILRCLQRRLLLDAPVIGNTAWLPAPEMKNGELPPAAARIIREADAFVQMHLQESISLPELARHCGVSPSHLNLLFGNFMGISAKRFVNQQRVRAAQRMLVNSNAPVKEIARLVGFSQASHFCQVFQRVALMSPGRFRAQNKSEFQNLA